MSRLGKLLRSALERVTDPCLLGHTNEWTRIRVGAVYYKACSRCTRPMKEILGDEPVKRVHEETPC